MMRVRTAAAIYIVAVAAAGLVAVTHFSWLLANGG